MRSMKNLTWAVALLCAASANAQVLGSTSTYSGLRWNVSTSTPGLSACTQLTLDATGDVSHSDNYAVYGQLYCPALNGGYASSGNAYFDSLGTFNMTVSLGVTYKMVCSYLSASTLSGSCPVYDNLGVQQGTAYITF